MKLPQPRKYKSDKMKFEDMIGFGENPQGFTSQTANGTAHWHGTGWNLNGSGGWLGYSFHGPGIGGQVEPDATRPAGRSNLTGC